MTQTAVITETEINGTLYLVTAECSETATETIEKKLERLICRHASDTDSYQSNIDLSVDVSDGRR